MDDVGSLSIDRLPTLTEVLELGREQEGASTAPPEQPETATALPVPSAIGQPVAQSPTRDATALVSAVLAALEPRLGALLEARLRAALAPALARAADGLIRDARDELSLTLRDLVEESVAQALRLHSED